MHEGLLTDIVWCVLGAAVLSYLCRWLRQPLIVGYIVAGLVLGPLALKAVHDERSIQDLSEIGLALLLFTVGLEIDMGKLKESARTAGILTAVQIFGCAILAYATAFALGFRGLPAAYLGVALSTSSTLVAIKLLSDKAEVGTLAGRITIGILLFQDASEIVILALQTNVSNPSVGKLLGSVGAVAGIAVGSVLAAKYVLPPLLRRVAKSPEVMLVTSIAWCLAVAWAAARAGLSVPMGALIAGLSISNMPYSLDVVSKIRSLRDFFVILFFVSLGMQIQSPTRAALLAVAAFTAAAILGRVLTVIPTARRLGFGSYVGTLTSISLIPLSEFSLVVVALGYSYGHVDRSILSIVAMVMVATSAASTYLARFNDGIARWVDRRLPPERSRAPEAGASEGPAPILIVGCHRTGASLIEILRSRGLRFAVIDYNPEVYENLEERGVRVIHGDVSYPETFEVAGVEHAQLIVSTIPDDFLRGTDNLRILRMVRGINPKARVVLTAVSLSRARELYEQGADYVILHRWLAAERLAEIMASEDLLPARAAQVEKLKEAREVVP